MRPFHVTLSRKRHRGALVAQLVIVLLCVFAFGAAITANAASTITLDAALERALTYHPSVIEALEKETSSVLAYERQSARYRLNVSASTDVVAWNSSPKASEPAITSGLTLERPISVNASWQLAGGPTLGASVRFQNAEPSANESALSITSSWNLWPGPRADDQLYNWRVAGEALGDADLARRQAVQSALIDTYRRFRSLQVDQENLRSLAEEVTRNKRQLERVQVQFAQGLVTEAEVRLAEIDLERSVASLHRAQAQFDRTIGQFSRELGLDGEIVLAPLPDTLTVAPWPLTFEETIKLAQQFSTARISAQRQLEAATRKLDNAKRDLGLTASLNTRATVHRWDELPSFAAFLVVGYDLADGGVRKIDREQAQMEYDQAVRALQRLDESIRDDIDRRLIDLKWLENQVLWAREAYETAQEAYIIKQEQADQGLIRQEDADQSQLSARRAFLDWIQAYVEYETARLELIGLCGLSFEVEGTIKISI